MTDQNIPDPGRISPVKPVGVGEEGKENIPLGAQPFSSFMKQSPLASSEAPSTRSPFALMQGNVPLGSTPNVDTLMDQVNKAQSTSMDLQNQLRTPNLKLKASTKYLVRNKLMEANDNLRSLSTKIGATLPEEPDHSASLGPLGKFLSYITHGQQLMESAKSQLQVIKDKGTSVSPGDFLLVQLKMNKAQQLLSFSSILLSNAVSDIKQFMQIQL